VNKFERVHAALRGEKVDRVPISLWRHFYQQDRNAVKLAAATLDFYREFDLDLIKVTPSGFYAIEDWGAEIEYSGNDYDPPRCSKLTIQSSSTWRLLTVLDPSVGALGRELRVLQLIRQGLDEQVPCLMTIFSPLTIAYKLAGRRVLQDLREHPADLHYGLRVIAETMAHMAQASLMAGADGLFFATQLASGDHLSWIEYEEFGMPYDLTVLEAVAHLAELIVLHLHGHNVFFDLVNRYPVKAVNWHNQETYPSLQEARGLTDKAFLTGLDRNLLEKGSPESIAAQVQDAITQTDGCGLILAPACVIPTRASAENLLAARRAVEGKG
jgi:uroporphyrinogen decarboxylase